MPYINYTLISAANTSLTMQSPNYTDLNLFFALGGIGLLLLIVSLSKNFDTQGRIILSGMSAAWLLCTSYASLNVARIGYVLTNSMNESVENITYVTYVYAPVREVLTANWMSGLLVFTTILAIIVTIHNTILFIDEIKPKVVMTR